MKQNRIVVQFPCDVKFPPGFERVLDALVSMVCKAYERDHPDRVMWPSGIGGAPNMHYTDFDMSCHFVEVAEREASEKERARRQEAKGGGGE